MATRNRVNIKIKYLTSPCFLNSVLRIIQTTHKFCCIFFTPFSHTKFAYFLIIKLCARHSQCKFKYTPTTYLLYLAHNNNFTLPFLRLTLLCFSSSIKSYQLAHTLFLAIFDIYLALFAILVFMLLSSLIVS